MVGTYRAPNTHACIFERSLQIRYFQALLRVQGKNANLAIEAVFLMGKLSQRILKGEVSLYH
jgi:hypothetical protein